MERPTSWFRVWDWDSHIQRPQWPQMSDSVGDDKPNSHFNETIQRDFRPLVFFIHNSNLPGPLTKGLKYSRFWLSIRPKIWISSRNLNQNLKYVNPLVSGLGRFELGKNLVISLQRQKRSLIAMVDFGYPVSYKALSPIAKHKLL